MIVIVLGAVMINRGLILTGSGYDLRSIVGSVSRMSKPSSTFAQFPVTRASRRSRPTVLISDDNATDAHAASSASFPNDQMDVIRSGFSPNHFVLTRACRSIGSSTASRSPLATIASSCRA